MEYTKIYNQIIKRAKNRVLEGYKEKHHILPKCLGGSNDKSNLVELTAREHFLCHMLLCEICPNNRNLWYALFLMSINKNKKEHQKYKVSSREYERIKFKWNEYSKKRKKPEWFGDKIKSNERNKKMGISNSKPKPEGFGRNHSMLLKGKPKPEGFGEKISKVLKDKPNQMKGKTQKFKGRVSPNKGNKYKHSLESCAKKHKPILQYDLKENFIKEWSSIKEAKMYTKINNIPLALSGANKTAGKFIWRYKI